MTESRVVKNGGLRCFGLLRRKECWRLSLRGWIAAGLALAAAGTGLMLGIHPFLAVTHRVDSEFLVMEGIVPDFGKKECIRLYREGHYRKLLTTGGPLHSGVDLDPDDTYAHLSAKILRKFGMPPDLVEAVPAPGKRRDRTYASAVALREWFQHRRIPVKAINVVTIGLHARRTRLVFQKAFGAEVAIGIVSVENLEYNPRRWWRYSEGVKEVLSESIAYLYARFLFVPEKEPSPEPAPAPEITRASKTSADGRAATN